MKIKAREGDLFENLNGIIFDVKGLIHPPNRIIAFPRFIPDSSGNRKHGNILYKKIYALSARFKFLERNFPQYLVHDPIFDEKLCEVRFGDVKRYYNPVDRLKELHYSDELDKLEMYALEFLELMKDYADVPWSNMGISGSLLVKLYVLSSDIDPVVYGTKNCRNIYEALKMLQQDAKSAVKPYSMEELRELFRFRFPDTRVSFKDFVRTESRKVLQGKFKGRDYFVRFVKDWSEIQVEYGTMQFKNVGYAKIKAEIGDDSEAIFTPCSYKLRNVEVLEGMRLRSIEEIASFRGRFCEQARIGEVVIAQGKVERVIDNRQNREYFRLLLGNKPSDYMILV
jgi:predicted nucleotidyltransferase